MDFAALSRILDDAVGACPDARLVEVADRLTGAVHEAVSSERELLEEHEITLLDELR